MDVEPYKILEFIAGEWPVWYTKFRNTNTAKGAINVMLAEYDAKWTVNRTTDKSISILTFYSKEGYTRFVLQWM